MNTVQVGLIGVAGVLLALQIKKEKAEIGIYLCIATSLLIFFAMFQHIETLIKMVQEVEGMLHMDVAYIGTLMKMIGITYLAEFSSGICKDAGYQTIAAQVEIFGKLTILVLSLPILLTLLNTLQEFLG